jgi:segregation and condensation protein B
MDDLARRLEAVLFISPRAVSAAELSDACGQPEAAVRAALSALGDELNGARHGLEVREVSGGFTLAVCADCAEDVRRLTGAERPDDLSPALLETLAIVAYLQPVTRADVAEVRGVSSEWALSSLEERGLVEQQGRAETAGAPILYGTGERFLRLFGLRALGDLPPIEQFELAPDDVEGLRARLTATAERRRG